MDPRIVGVAAARLFLQQRISQQGKGPLPSLGELAYLAKVSRKTMWKAVGELTSQGILSTKQGRGVFIGPIPDPTPRPRAQNDLRNRWTHIKVALASDIVVGALSLSERLPTHKELLRRYAVNSRTLRKSLAALIAEGIVKQERAGYKIIRPVIPSAARSAIVLVLPENLTALMQWSYYTHGVQSFFTLLERECSSRGISLAWRTYAHAIHDVKLLRDALGSICWVGGNEEEAAAFFKALPVTKKPMAVIDYFSQFDLPEPCFNTHSVLTMTIDQRDSMLQLGRYALQLGHRHIAYFRASDDSGWPRLRLAGVQDAFQLAGIDVESLVVFDSRPSASPTLAAQTPRTAFETIGKQVNALVKNETLKGMLNMRLGEAGQYAEIAFLAANSFAAALERPEITAWICESQSLAVFGALPFLQARNIAVPQRLSVMAQGDAPEAFSAGLTSTTKRMDLCLEEIIRHILYPELRYPKPGRKQMILNAVAVRETSGKNPHIVA